MFWFGVQSAGGATAITQMITAIWPSYAHVHNSLPASAGITTKGLISYFIYHCLQTPFLFIRTEKLKWMFLAKTILVPPMALGMVIYLAVAAREAPSFWKQESTVTGTTRAWLWLSSMTSITGGFSTLAVNIPDFSRFVRKPGSQVWQLPFIPVFKILSVSLELWGLVHQNRSMGRFFGVRWTSWRNGKERLVDVLLLFSVLHCGHWLRYVSTSLLTLCLSETASPTFNF